MKRWLLVGTSVALVAVAALVLVVAKAASPTVAATMAPRLLAANGAFPSQPQEQKPWVGVALMTLNQRLKERWDLKVDKGVVVARVVKDSPAAKAGFKERDVITAVGGTAVEKVKDVQDRVQSAKIGDGLTFTVRRGDEQLSLSVTLEAQPERPKPEGAPRPFRGFGPGWGRLGAQHTVQTSRGTVTAVGTDQLTIKLEGTDRTVTYQVTDKTSVIRSGGKEELSDLKSGDRVSVVSVDGGQEAKVVFKAPDFQGRAFFWRGHGFAIPFRGWLSPFPFRGFPGTS